MPQSCSDCSLLYDCMYCSVNQEQVSWMQLNPVFDGDKERNPKCPLRKQLDVVFVLVVMWQADDPFYPDYEKIDGIYSTLEKAKARRKVIQKQNNHEYGYKGVHIRVTKLDGQIIK